MTASTRAGIVYFAAVFGVGFALGTLRQLFVAPRVGNVVAVLIELPLVLSAAWWLSRRLVAHFAVPARTRCRIEMGGAALVLLLLAEFGLSAWVFGNSLGQQLAGYMTLAGSLGLAGQLAFAAFPWLELLTAKAVPAAESERR
jgi:hypothetical protein